MAPLLTRSRRKSRALSCTSWSRAGGFWQYEARRARVYTSILTPAVNRPHPAPRAQRTLLQRRLVPAARSRILVA